MKIVELKRHTICPVGSEKYSFVEIVVTPENELELQDLDEIHSGGDFGKKTPSPQITKNFFTFRVNPTSIIELIVRRNRETENAK